MEPVTGKNGTYEIDLEIFNAMSVFDWNQLYGLGAADAACKCSPPLRLAACGACGRGYAQEAARAADAAGTEEVAE